MREGWIYKPLGEICNVVGGGTPSKRNPAFYEGDVPWATVRDMIDEALSRTEFKISSEAVKSSATNVIPPGNVVIATRVGLGKVCLLSQATAINQDLRGIIPKAKNLDVRFLFRWLQSVSHVIEAEGTGATVKGVKLPFVKSLQIPVPSVPEQKRIVAILDEAFVGIATAVANTAKNLANARELFESYLNAIFSKRGEGWIEPELSSLITISHGFAFKGSDFQVSSDASRPIVLTPGNYTELAELDFSNKNTKRFFGKAPVGFLFNKGDLTIVMTDLSSKMKILGKPAFINKPNVLHNQRIGRVILNGDMLDPRFLYYFMRTRYVSEEIKRTSTGTMVKHTAPRRILALRIPLPPSPQSQREIVSSLDALSTEVRRAESIFRQKLDALAELKQSLLQKAFSGELTAVPQDEIETAVA